MKLIILNGTTGVGKTTLSKKLHEALPFSCAINIDEQRKLISNYKDDRDKSRLISFEIGLGMVEACLKNDVDVILDKMMYDGKSENVLGKFIELGKKYGAEIHEFILWADKKTVEQRLKDRGFNKGGLLTPEKADKFWQEMENFKEQRTEAVVVDTSKLSEDEVFQKVSSLSQIS